MAHRAVGAREEVRTVIAILAVGIVVLVIGVAAAVRRAKRRQRYDPSKIYPTW